MTELVSTVAITQDINRNGNRNGNDTDISDLERNRKRVFADRKQGKMLNVVESINVGQKQVVDMVNEYQQSIVSNTKDVMNVNMRILTDIYDSWGFISEEFMETLDAMIEYLMTNTKFVAGNYNQLSELISPEILYYTHSILKLGKINRSDIFVVSSAFLGDNNGLPIVVKRDKLSLLYGEFAKGKFVMNDMRKYCPNFMYTYALVEEENGYNGSLLLENVGSTTMKEFVRSSPRRVEFFSVLAQTFMSLRMAYEIKGFTHYDLHTSNVIVRIVDDADGMLKYQYRKNGTLTDVYIKVLGVLPTIIDFGQSRTDYDGNFLGDMYIGEFHRPDKIRPLQDIHKLLWFIVEASLEDGQLSEISEWALQILEFFYPILSNDDIMNYLSPNKTREYNVFYSFLENDDKNHIQLYEDFIDVFVNEMYNEEVLAFGSPGLLDLRDNYDENLTDKVTESLTDYMNSSTRYLYPIMLGTSPKQQDYNKMIALVKNSDRILTSFVDILGARITLAAKNPDKLLRILSNSDEMVTMRTIYYQMQTINFILMIFPDGQVESINRVLIEIKAKLQKFNKKLKNAFKKNPEYGALVEYFIPLC